MQLVLVPTAISGHPVFTYWPLGQFLGDVFNNLTGRRQGTLPKPIHEDYYFIFLSVCEALNRFGVEFMGGTLGCQNACATSSD
jgi:hypothetical protein